MDLIFKFASEHTFEFVIICAVVVYAVERTITAIANSRRPIVQRCECDCECCHEEG